MFDFNFPPGTQAMSIPSQATSSTAVVNSNLPLLQVLYHEGKKLMQYFGLLSKPTTRRLTEDEEYHLLEIRSKTTGLAISLQSNDVKLRSGREYLDEQTLAFYKGVDSLCSQINTALIKHKIGSDHLDEIHKNWTSINSKYDKLNKIIKKGLSCQILLSSSRFKRYSCEYNWYRDEWEFIAPEFNDNRYKVNADQQGNTKVFSYLYNAPVNPTPTPRPSLPSENNQSRLRG